MTDNYGNPFNNGRETVKGRFGLAWVSETPMQKCSTPCGWQIDIIDSPSRVEQTCQDMMKWANCPPISTSEPAPKCCCCNQVSVDK